MWAASWERWLPFSETPRKHPVISHCEREKDEMKHQRLLLPWS